MPELPEVETIVQGLLEPLVGRRFTGVRVGWENLIARPGPDESLRRGSVLRSAPAAGSPPRLSEGSAVEEFERGLVGQGILGLKRRGKYLVFTLSSGKSLIIHLRMTGRLMVKGPDVEIDRHDHLIFELDDGRELRFNNVRKLGRVYLVDDEGEIVGRLGPEPLDDDFTPDDFATLISGRRGKIKPLLLNQQFIAGVGNIYADEALFAAHLHPERSADTLTAEEVECLYHAIRQVLVQAIQNQGTSFSDYRDAKGAEGRNQEYIRVSRRSNLPCLRCGTPIERMVVGGRGTYFCPTCQRKC